MLQHFSGNTFTACSHLMSVNNFLNRDVYGWFSNGDYVGILVNVKEILGLWDLTGLHTVFPANQ